MSRTCLDCTRDKNSHVPNVYILPYFLLSIEPVFSGSFFLFFSITKKTHAHTYMRVYPLNTRVESQRPEINLWPRKILLKFIRWVKVDIRIWTLVGKIVHIQLHRLNKGWFPRFFYFRFGVWLRFSCDVGVHGMVSKITTERDYALRWPVEHRSTISICSSNCRGSWSP